MSQWDKLIAAILAEDQKLRFEDLRKALIRFGYTQTQPGGGSSHYTFRKPGCPPITIPKHSPLKKVYIEMVAALIRAEQEDISHE